MGDNGFIELIVACASWQEAQGIADMLLEKHLVACAEFIPVKSRYHWKQKVEAAEEVRLVMLSRADNFAKAERVVTRLHSYETPVLYAVPVAIMNEPAAQWLSDNTESEQ